MSRKQFEDVPCKFGAPMGRPEVFNDFSGKVRCFKVNFVSGDYDDGSAYWGGYPSLPLYCATKQDGTVTNGNGLLIFSRAENRKDAKINFQSRANNFHKKITWIN
jgi:hypothetical protein